MAPGGEARLAVAQTAEVWRAGAKKQDWSLLTVDVSGRRRTEEMAWGEFSGRRVVVTGGGAGIGRGIAEAYVREGAAVAIVDLVADRANEAAVALNSGPGKACAVSGDVRSPESVGRVVHECVEDLGGIDVLVNNAGIYPNCPVLEMSVEEWDAVIDTSLKGTFLMSAAVSRHMVAQGIEGHIVNIASISYKSARRGAAHYCAAKAGVVMFSKTLAQELAESKIHVNVVSPNLVDVGRGFNVSESYWQATMMNIPWGRVSYPKEIAEAVLFLTSSRAAYITGAVLDVDGGASTGRFFLPYSQR